MELVTIVRGDARYPEELERLTKPPKALYCLGRDVRDVMNRPRAAVVGSRSVTAYGRQTTRDITRRLAEQGVVIISGLAYGVDAEAHQAALDAGGITVAVLPSPVQAVAPAGNQRLARRILAQGGALISTYPFGSPTHKGNFVERNEYVAALSQVMIVTEAGERSGARHTARFAGSEQIDCSVYAVPGNINSRMSVGANRLIADSEAKIYTSFQEVCDELGLGRQTKLQLARGDNPAQQLLLDLIVSGVGDGQTLLTESALSIAVYNQTLTMLEISGKIRPLGGNIWGLT